MGILLPSLVLASEFSELLHRADAVRSSDRAAFDKSLARLEALKGEANAVERAHLELLLNYQKVIRGDYQSALGSASVMFDQVQEPQLKYRSGLLVANIAALTREFSLGLRFLESALELREKIHDADIRHGGDVVAGNLYNQYGQYALGLEHAERLLSDAPSARNRCFADKVRFEAMSGLGHLVETRPHILTSIARCSEQGEVLSANAIRSVLAQRWAANGKVRQAIAFLEASLPEVEATGYTRLIGEYRALLATYQLELGNEKTAEMHAVAVTELKGQDSGSLPNVMARHVLYRVALGRGDTRAALNEYRLYAEADKARLDDIKAREYAFQLSRHEVAQKNQSIELLKSQNQLLRLEQEVAHKEQSNSQLMIALLFVLASSLGYWGWRGRRMHRTLRQLAQTDSLTGLANRRHFRAQSEALLAQARQRGRPMSLLLFDLDHFKQINDQCGHATGDWVLKEVARVGRVHCRPGDVFGRIGGEEFAVALVDCDLGDAEIIAERMREAIAVIDGRASGCPLPVSASVGCVATSVSGHEYETLVAHADAAMYRSKVGGRNRISRYQTASATPVPVPVRIESVPVAAAPEAMRAS
ncbi:GGDEF domain-containing protein [Lysobacter bugurensis]|uniref:diguanylate cyclase n=1 Tax=Cognatilysobacter bugurensis TaxID=543356 RepID=A0A918T5D2_9GAMM|nr:GGDEF domain-containing protein [Lysobacter bugurensis]